MVVSNRGFDVVYSSFSFSLSIYFYSFNFPDYSPGATVTYKGKLKSVGKRLWAQNYEIDE